MKNYTFTLFNLKCCVSALDKRCARNIIISEIMANKQLYINNYNAIYGDYNKKGRGINRQVSPLGDKPSASPYPLVPPEEELFDFLVTYIDETNILEE
jgi:hypothetical protein